MNKFFLVALALFGNLFSEDYLFEGKHFVASYMECDLRSLTHLDGLISAMTEAVNSSGATILDQSTFIFPPNGLTMVYLLSESHATIHTYPEHGSCFVDLFTCGNTCSSEKFDEVLRDYLQPKKVNARLFERSEKVGEIPYPQ